MPVLTQRTIRQIIDQIDSNLVHENHRTHAEVLHWCTQWKLVAVELAQAIQLQQSRAGSTISEAKSEAARLNGRKGGRPKKR